MLTANRYRTLAMASFLLAMTLVTLQPAWAWAGLGQQPTGDGQKHGDGSVGVTASNDNNSPGGNVSSGGPVKSDGGGSSPCQWTYLGHNDSAGTGGYTGSVLSLTVGTGAPTLIDQGAGGTYIPAASNGTWFLKSCPGQVPVSVFVPAGQAAPAPVSPQQLAVEARNQLTPGAPVVQMSPPSTSSTAWQYTNLPTWVWVAPAQWKTLHATASVPGVTVTATAVPVRLILSYQDGVGGTQSVLCDGPGTPYSDALAASESPSRPIAAASPDCGWIWQHSGVNSSDGKLQVTASIVYNASWTAAGAPGGGNLGTISSPPAIYRVTVGQIEAIVTGGH